MQYRANKLCNSSWLIKKILVWKRYFGFALFWSGSSWMPAKCEWEPDQAGSSQCSGEVKYSRVMCSSVSAFVIHSAEVKMSRIKAILKQAGEKLAFMRATGDLQPHGMFLKYSSLIGSDRVVHVPFTPNLLTHTYTFRPVSGSTRSKFLGQSLQSVLEHTGVKQEVK